MTLSDVKSALSCLFLSKGDNRCCIIVIMTSSSLNSKAKTLIPHVSRFENKAEQTALQSVEITSWGLVALREHTKIVVGQSDTPI